MVTGRPRNLLVLAAALGAGLAGVGFASAGFTGAGFTGAGFSSTEFSSTGPSASDPLAGLAGRSEGVIVGEVMARSVRAFQAPDGGELFFTTLRVSGTDLATSSPVTIEVIFAGGFISETTQSGKVEELRKLGVKAFLQKPFKAENLLSSLEDTLN